MHSEDRSELIARIANLWSFNALFLSRLMLVLREEGTLSAGGVEKLLQDLDRGIYILDGMEEQAFVTRLLATVRAVVAADGRDPAAR
jgi:hypothetical protein